MEAGVPGGDRVSSGGSPELTNALAAFHWRRSYRDLRCHSVVYRRTDITADGVHQIAAHVPAAVGGAGRGTPGWTFWLSTEASWAGAALRGRSAAPAIVKSAKHQHLLHPAAPVASCVTGTCHGVSAVARRHHTGPARRTRRARQSNELRCVSVQRAESTDQPRRAGPQNAGASPPPARRTPLTAGRGANSWCLGRGARAGCCGQSVTGRPDAPECRLRCASSFISVVRMRCHQPCRSGRRKRDRHRQMNGAGNFVRPGSVGPRCANPRWGTRAGGTCPTVPFFAATNVLSDVAQLRRFEQPVTFGALRPALPQQAGAWHPIPPALSLFANSPQTLLSWRPRLAGFCKPAGVAGVRGGWTPSSCRPSTRKKWKTSKENPYRKLSPRRMRSSPCSPRVAGSAAQAPSPTPTSSTTPTTGDVVHFGPVPASTRTLDKINKDGEEPGPTFVLFGRRKQRGQESTRWCSTARCT